MELKQIIIMFAKIIPWYIYLKNNKIIILAKLSRSS